MHAAVVEPLSSIRPLINRPAVRVPSGTTLADAALTMRRENVSSVLIDPHGMIATERDLTRAFAAGLGPDVVIETVSSHPIRVSSSISIVEAAALMLNEEVRHLVVDHCMCGESVISLRAVMAVLLQAVSPHIWLDRLRIAVL